MTTIAEFKKMLQEEINEPLDYPRVPGLTPKELRAYNSSYSFACELVLFNEADDDDEWLGINLKWLPRVIANNASPGHIGRAGRHAAYTWALEELKGLEGETTKTLPFVHEPWLARPTHEFKLEFSPEPGHDYVAIDRTRYNHLLEVERNAQEFVESFTRWEA